MLRIVLWLAAASVVILAVLWFSREMESPSEPPKAVEAPSVEAQAEPAAAKVEAPLLPVAPPAVPTPDEMQVQEDAAATGMTTTEPEEETPGAPPPVETPEPK